MKKINILQKSNDFERIIKNNKSYKYKDFIIYIEHNKEDVYHFGISVGKKIGNAVTRNKVKRQIKSIIDKKNYEKGFNCIIIVGRGILNKKYDEIEKNLFDALYKIDIVKGEINE